VGAFLARTNLMSIQKAKNQIKVLKTPVFQTPIIKNCYMTANGIGN
jgi:hypothetical protein